MDTTPPVISVVGSNPYTQEALLPYVDPGATALDNYDGNLTAQIVAANNVYTGTLGAYSVTYNVSDSSGNGAVPAIRIVNVVDTTPPAITVLGDDPVYIYVGYYYADDGATATDNYDGDLTSAIATVNPVDTNVEGTYFVTYDVQDSSRNAAPQMTRTVFVLSY